MFATSIVILFVPVVVLAAMVLLCGIVLDRSSRYQPKDKRPTAPTNTPRRRHNDAPARSIWNAETLVDTNYYVVTH